VGGVLGVDDREVDPQVLAQGWQPSSDGIPAGAADYVTQKEYPHIGSRSG
jgi:hypothetical protein